MNQFYKRIKRLENVKRYENKPYLIIVSKYNDCFQILEQYCRQNLKNSVISRSGSQKITYAQDINDYTIPDGFTGVYITGEYELED